MDPIVEAQRLASQGQVIPPDLQRKVFQKAAADNMTSAQLEQMFNMPAGTASQAAQALGISNQIPQQLGGIANDNSMLNDASFYANNPDAIPLNSSFVSGADNFTAASGSPGDASYGIGSGSLGTQEGNDAFINQSDPLVAQGAANLTKAPTGLGTPQAPQYTQAQIDAVVNDLNSGKTTVEEIAAQYGVTPDEVKFNLNQINNTRLQGSLGLPDADGDYTQGEIDQVTKLLQDGKLTTAQASNFYNVPQAEIQSNLDALTGKVGSGGKDDVAGGKDDTKGGVATTGGVTGGVTGGAVGGTAGGTAAGAGGVNTGSLNLPPANASGQYSQADTLKVAGLINSGQLTAEEAAKIYGVDTKYVENNLKTINANDPNATSVDMGDFANQSKDYKSTGNETGLIGAENAQAQGLSGALTGIQRGTNTASNLIGLGATDASSVIGKQYFQNQGMFDPYRVGGESALQKQLALSGSLGKEAFDAAYQASPQMQFLQDRGERAVARNAAAIGGLGGGNVQKELAKYSQGLASQDLQNQIGNLQAITGTGLDASQQAATLGTRGAESMADIYGQRAIRQADLASRGAERGADYLFQTGQNVGRDRMTAGRDIASNIASQMSNLANFQNAQGAGISQMTGQQGDALQAILAQAGANTANQVSNAAANRMNMAQSMGANSAALIGGVPQRRSGALSEIGKAAGGVGTAITAFSDIRLKDNITKIGVENGFNIYSWDWNEKGMELGADKYPTIGVIAQEVQETRPDAVSTEDGYLKVDYAKLHIQ